MKLLRGFAVIGALVFGTGASAEGIWSAFGALDGHSTLGYGRIFSNDFFGDGVDRWRTGSYSFSMVRGKGWTGEAPDRPFELMEYRLRSEIIAPSKPNGAGSDDRPYVGALSAGVLTHFQPVDGINMRAGADLIALGPQTGMSRLQAGWHELFSLPTLSQGVIDGQLANAFHLAGSIELSHDYKVNDRLTVRPFAEGHVGSEQIARVGTDLIIGDVGQTDMFLRDVVTGQMARAIEGDAGGFGYIVGADAAYVGDSIYFPESSGVETEDMRFRARAGLHWQIAPDMSFFYGLTYLSKELKNQPEGQFLGSLKLNFNF
ncbi:MAG: DUF2219 family protein [Marivivens sp.]|nr:DUF2219 family protein [Marivivens sp.]